MNGPDEIDSGYTKSSDDGKEHTDESMKVYYLNQELKFNQNWINQNLKDIDSLKNLPTASSEDQLTSPNAEKKNFSLIEQLSMENDSLSKRQDEIERLLHKKQSDAPRQ